MKKNAVLDRLAQPHLKRPAGRPPREGYQKIIELGAYRAEAWKHAQRLLLVVVDEPDRRSSQLAFHIAQAVRPILELLMGRLAKWQLPERLSNGRQPRAKSWTPPPRHSFHEVVLRL